MNPTDIFSNVIFQLFAVIIIFLVLTVLGRFIYDKLKNAIGKYVSIHDLLPEDEVHSLIQIFYLIMMALCVVDLCYAFMGSERDLLYLIIFDIVLSLYFAITLDMGSRKGKVIWLLLVPYGAISLLLFGFSLMVFGNLIHALVILYFAKLYFDKFMEYTNSNGLGITIVLLFVIIFGGFFVAQYSEGANALDSLVIVSNQFTGNGYGVFGDSILGKLDSLLLVWGGYVLSGVGAATLTAAILTRHFKKQFAELKELIEEGDAE